jgi:hypothetical protein
MLLERCAMLLEQQRCCSIAQRCSSSNVAGAIALLQLRNVVRAATLLERCATLLEQQRCWNNNDAGATTVLEPQRY